MATATQARGTDQTAVAETRDRPGLLFPAAVKLAVDAAASISSRMTTTILHDMAHGHVTTKEVNSVLSAQRVLMAEERMKYALGESGPRNGFFAEAPRAQFDREQRLIALEAQIQELRSQS